MGWCTAHVRFRGQSGHDVLHCTCLLLTQSGAPRAARLLTHLWANLLRGHTGRRGYTDTGRGYTDTET
jgi:hypothetical protein